MAYFLQTISSNDEAEICPNSHSPRSWYSCADLETCRDPVTAMYARVSRRVLRLVCIDQSPFAPGICEPGDIYYLKHLEPLGGGLAFGGGLTSACLVYDDPTIISSGNSSGPKGVVRRDRRRMPMERIDPVTTADGDLCTPPLPIDDLAMIFAPVREEGPHPRPHPRPHPHPHPHPHQVGAAYSSSYTKDPIAEALGVKTVPAILLYAPGGSEPASLPIPRDRKQALAH